VLVAAVDRIGRGGIAVVHVARSERGTPVDETVGDDRQIAPALEHAGFVD